jgi:hypothetical protein
MPAAGSVVIVTFNSALYIEACLKSLEGSGWERIVVDNASADSTLGRVRRFRSVQVLANRENRGFAAAANQGAHAARGDWLLFLNPDVRAAPEALDGLRRAAAEAGAAAAGGRLLNPDGSLQIGFAVRRLPTLVTALSEVLLLNRLFPRNPWNRRYRCLDLNYEESAEIEQPPGACLLVKRSVWEALGGFDEGFFPLWFEDVDFCKRLRAVGLRVLYEPRARFWHVGAHSLGTLAPGEEQVYWYRNLLHYFRKHHSALAMEMLRGAILAGMLLRMLATALGLDRRSQHRRATVSAYAQVIRSCVFGAIP